MKKYIKQILFASLCCLVLGCASISVVKADEIAPTQIQGGDSKETAQEIQFNTVYEAIVPLKEENGEYNGETWYKFSLPQYAHHFAIAASPAVFGVDSSIQVTDASLGSHVRGIRINGMDTAYFEPKKDTNIFYVKVSSKSPETKKFEIVPIINPLEKDNAVLNFNQEYNEVFYTQYPSVYNFTAPYTGKYRIYYNSENGESARYIIKYYTGQTVEDKTFKDKGSTIIELKGGIKYKFQLMGEDVYEHGRAVSANIYISDEMINSIEVDKKNIALNKSEQYQLTTTVLPEKAVDTSVKYSTSNNKVALVTQDGCITAVGPGIATITIDSNDGSGVQAKCKVKVSSVKVNRLDLSARKLVIDKKGSYRIKATTYPARADNPTVTFKSSNSKIVTVDKNRGKIIPKKPGTAIITCTTNDGSKITKKCRVIVKPIKYKKVKMGDFDRSFGHVYFTPANSNITYVLLNRDAYNWDCKYVYMYDTKKIDGEWTTKISKKIPKY